MAYRCGNCDGTGHYAVTCTSVQSALKTCSGCGRRYSLDMYSSRSKINKTLTSVCRFCDAQRSLLVKLAVIQAYGDKCFCCGEAEIGFLTIDHAEDNGSFHRSLLGNSGGMTFYRWLRKNDYPKSLGLRVLCYNCNSGRSSNGGVCPHKHSYIGRLTQELASTTIAKYKKTRRSTRLKIKQKVLTYFGGKCVCCLESELGFLTLDHINNDGLINRSLNGTGVLFYTKLYNNNYKISTPLQVLCFNCNCGRDKNFTICPHKVSQQIHKSYLTSIS